MTDNLPCGAWSGLESVGGSFELSSDSLGQNGSAYERAATPVVGTRSHLCAGNGTSLVRSPSTLALTAFKPKKPRANVGSAFGQGPIAVAVIEPHTCQPLAKWATTMYASRPLLFSVGFRRPTR